MNPAEKNDRRGTTRDNRLHDDQFAGRFPSAAKFSMTSGRTRVAGANRSEEKRQV